MPFDSSILRQGAPARFGSLATRKRVDTIDVKCRDATFSQFRSRGAGSEGARAVGRYKTSFIPSDDKIRIVGGAGPQTCRDGRERRIHVR